MLLLDMLDEVAIKCKVRCNMTTFHRSENQVICTKSHTCVGSAFDDRISRHGGDYRSYYRSIDTAVDHIARLSIIVPLHLHK